MPKDMEFEIEPTNVRLRDAGPHHCRWIADHCAKGEFIICGRPVRSGSAYCEYHHAVVWRKTGEGRSRTSTQASNWQCRAQSV